MLRRIPATVILLGLAIVLGAVGCNRNIEDFDPTEQVIRPDLSKIFPEGAESAAKAPVIAGSPPPGSGPRGARSPGAPPAAETGEPLAGTIRLASEVEGRIPNGAILFLIVRPIAGGPPTAVRRIADPRFPLEFTLGPEHRMAQSVPFVGPFTLTARVDADGNAMTREPGDLQGMSVEQHSPGDTGIELVIDEVL